MSSAREIALAFLKLGATAYGGPATMGIMQAELQEKRQWVSKPRFVEGLSIANLLPGATATQLAMFLGYVRGGWWGGLLGGLCFMLPGVAIILALTLAYATLGSTPILKSALYGLGPVVVGIYAVAIYRLGRSAIVGRAPAVIAIVAGAMALAGILGLTMILLFAGGVGILLFASRRIGLIILATLVAGLALAHFLTPVPVAQAAAAPRPATLAALAFFLLEVGAFTFGGGLTMLAFIQQQLVERWQWLTSQEFIDGLALGQLTPGPVLSVAAYVGYKISGLTGAVVGAAAAFLPSFVLMLGVLPVLERTRELAWMRAAMRGIGPAVIGVLAVSLARLTPHAVPDVFSMIVLVGTVVVLALRHLGPFNTMLAGAALGVVRKAYVWR